LTRRSAPLEKHFCIRRCQSSAARLGYLAATVTQQLGTHSPPNCSSVIGCGSTGCVLIGQALDGPPLHVFFVLHPIACLKTTRQ
ncbi:hypothetical protein GOODEAATRI_021819, partial [Goodea atripinnis]